MSRLFLAVLLVVLLSLSIPTLRSRAMPKYSAAGDWVWVRVEGPLTPALNPLRKLQTESEMGSVLRSLVSWRNRGFAPPEPHEIAGFMAWAGIDSTATDAWGTSYEFEVGADSVYLRSAAADLQMRTPDDIVKPLRYPSPYRFKRPTRLRR